MQSKELTDIQIINLLELKLSRIITISKSIDKKEKNDIFLTNINHLRGFLSGLTKSSKILDELKLFINSSGLPCLKENINNVADVASFAAQLFANLKNFANTQCLNSFLFMKSPTLLKEVILSTINDQSPLNLADQELIAADYHKAVKYYNEIKLPIKTTQVEQGLKNYIISQNLIAHGLAQWSKLNNITQEDSSAINDLDNHILESCNHPACTDNPYATGQFQILDGHIPTLKAQCLLSWIVNEFPRKDIIKTNGEHIIQNSSYLTARLMIRQLYGYDKFTFAIDKLFKNNQKEEATYIPIPKDLLEYFKDTKVQQIFTQKLLQELTNLLIKDSNYKFSNNPQKTSSDEEGMTSQDRKDLTTYIEKIEEITNIKRAFSTAAFTN